jgi:hypothetical protein
MEAAATTQRYADSFIQYLSSGPETVYFVDPGPIAFRELVDVLEIIKPTVQVLGCDSALNRAMDNFMIGALAADFIANDELALRTADLDRTTRIVGPSATIPLVELNGAVTGIGTKSNHTSDDFADVTFQWAAADPFSVATPSLSLLRESLAAQVCPLMLDTFNTLLDATDAVCTRGNGVGAVALALLAGATHEVLLNDVSTWAADIGLASSSTISRTKTNLEDEGFITTEKIRRRVGRPRQRLHLAAGLEDNSTTEIASLANERLSS